MWYNSNNERVFEKKRTRKAKKIMKRKTILSLTSLLLGATLFSACTDTNYKVAFDDYWKYDVTIPQTAMEETLTYKVTFDDDMGINNYSLQYQEGTYTTKLTGSMQGDKLVYTYETELAINAIYQLDATQSEPLANVVKSSVTFLSAADGLKPISSHKEIDNYSPVNISEATKVEDCYKRYRYTLDVTYDETKVTAVVTNEALKETAEGYTPSTHETTIDNSKYSYLDNEQVLLALRGVNPTTTASPSLLVYAPFSKAVQTLKASYSTSATAGDFTFEMDGETAKRNIAYYTVTLGIDANDSGKAQTVQVAKVTNAKANDYRNVILKYEAPVAFNLGTLVYELQSAKFINKQ